MSRFEACMEFIAQWEGGKVDDKLDRGGRTAYGVTQRTYDAYRRKRGLPLADVWDIEPNEVKDVYLTDFWSPLGCASLPEPLDLVVFDTGVNCGHRRAVRWLQTALGMSGAEIDGVMGPHTLLHVQESTHDLDGIVQRFMELRDHHYTAIVERDPTQQRFIKGWRNRLLALNDTITGAA